ncbi:kinase-like domain-containing protein [Vararia minispora EC-137]|uniref:Kinase-like domain-containing protein n=1 Tax=Vararia minispora EC-137 TaxID=1314806 RepID=A0ACB8QT19_9AGAM|nr:kinase-like domain-containing protein [Vararia minispora EC-137]
MPAPTDPDLEVVDTFPHPRRHKGTYRLTDFTFLRTLGTGSFGRVHLVRSIHNRRFYAIKVLNKEKIVAHKQIDHTNNEQQMLLAVQHPFIVNLWGTFQDPTNLYMVMDFVPGGELFTLLRRSNRFPEPVAKFYAAEVALALNHLHGMNIVYRDLKPENILLAIDGHIKIADFGFAKYCPNTTWTLCGTPDYLAPEVIQQRRYNKSVDWYALGILIFEMLTGLPPFHRQDDTPMNLYSRIQMGAAAIRWPAALGPLARDVILRFLEADPSKRFGNLHNGAGDVFGHGWFREVDWSKLRAREITAPYLPRIIGEGDASAFEAYAEDGVAMMYGLAADDPHGLHFPDFEYTAEGPSSITTMGMNMGGMGMGVGMSSAF